MVLQKKLSCLLITISFLILTSSAQQEPLSLQKCFQLALQNNIDLKVARYLPEIAQANVLLARSPYDVFVTGGYEYSKLDSRLQQEKKGLFNIGIGKRFLTGTEVGLEYGMEHRRGTEFDDLRFFNSFLALQNLVPFDNNLDIKKLWTSGVTVKLTQPLLRNFGITANKALIDAARKGVHIADYQLELQINKILGQVEVTYWQWLLAINNKMALQDSIENGKQYKQLVEQQATRVEGVLPSDVNDANVDLYKRENELISLEKELRIASDRLKRLIFPFDPDNFAQKTWQKSFVPTKADQATFETLQEAVADVKKAIEQRPEVKILQKKIESLALVIVKSENEMLPALDLAGSVSFLGEEEITGRAFSKGFNGDHYRWSVGVSLEIPLGNLAAKSRLYRARSQKLQTDTELHRLEYDISLEIREALHEVNAARQRYEKSVEILQNAQRRLASLERRYHNPLQGDFNLIFFLQDAEIKKTEGAITRNQALFEYKAALVQLKVAEARYLYKTPKQSK